MRRVIVIGHVGHKGVGLHWDEELIVGICQKKMIKHIIFLRKIPLIFRKAVQYRQCGLVPPRNQAVDSFKLSPVGGFVACSQQYDEQCGYCDRMSHCIWFTMQR